MEDEKLRETFNEMVREKNRLKERTKTVVSAIKGEDSDDSDMSGEESAGELKKKAI